VEFEKRYVHKGGEAIWARLKISIVCNSNGAPLYFITHVEDITARRRAARALQESEQKYRSLITHIPDLVWVADATGGVAFISPNVESLMGLSPDEVYKRGMRALFDLIHAEDVQRVTGAFEALFSRKQPYDVEFRVHAPGGEWVWVHDRAWLPMRKMGFIMPAAYARTSANGGVPRRPCARETVRRLPTGPKARSWPT
jgi:PAS domain S-box-containing protein